MVAQTSEDIGEGAALAARAGAAMSLVPAVGAASGALVVLMSACSVEGLRTLAAAWDGPVLVVGSAEEARAVIGTGAAPPVAAEPAAGALHGLPAADGVEAGPGPLWLDADRQVVGSGEQHVPLTPLEFRFLTALSVVPGRLRNFEELTQEVWGTPHIGDVAQVHSLVKRLRRKLRTLGSPVRLQAVRGLGFRLAGPGVLAPVED